MTTDDRLAKLAYRIGWLDRNHRRIAVGIAIATAAIGVVVMPDVLGSEWPRFHARLTALAFAALLAFVVELGLAGTIAIWEVQHDRLRGVRLPRAMVRRSRVATRAVRSAGAENRTGPEPGP